LSWELKKGWTRRRRRRGVQGEASRQRKGQEKTSLGRRKAARDGKETWASAAAQWGL